MAEDEKPEEKTMEFTEADPETQQRSIGIEFIIEDTDISYADQYVVQNFPHEFIISFFQTEHPLIFTEDDFRKLGNLHAYCIFRVALRPSQAKELSDILQRNIAIWEDGVKKRKEAK